MKKVKVWGYEDMVKF